MEEWGSGYQRISAACRQGGYPEPEWLELGSCVRVIFRPHPHIPEDDTINDRINDTINDRINERQEWFLTEISRHIPVKAEHIAQQWGVGVATARRDIAELKRMDLIEFDGPLKTGSYRLKRKKEH